jgi:hypothetical protein
MKYTTANTQDWEWVCVHSHTVERKDGIQVTCIMYIAQTINGDRVWTSSGRTFASKRGWIAANKEGDISPEMATRKAAIAAITN